MRFPEKLRELRTENNLSQYDLAEILDISQSAIAKWELKKTEPTASYLIKLSLYFNISTDELLGLSDESGRKNKNID